MFFFISYKSYTRKKKLKNLVYFFGNSINLFILNYSYLKYCISKYMFIYTYWTNWIIESNYSYKNSLQISTINLRVTKEILFRTDNAWSCNYFFYARRSHCSKVIYWFHILHRDISVINPSSIRSVWDCVSSRKKRISIVFNKTLYNVNVPFEHY